MIAVRLNVKSFSDYFLFKVTSDVGGGSALEDDLRSSGHLYCSGTNIVKGVYYEFIKATRKGSEYKLSSSIAIPVVCIVYMYVGINLNEKGGDSLSLKNEDYEDILHCFLA